MVYFQKRTEAPASLSKRKSYTGEDVIKALVEDSGNKCYLCGTYAPVPVNVEHFHEKREDEDKKYDWNNLFLSCSHCNGVKNDTYRSVDSDLLNCTDLAQKVDVWISYRLASEERVGDGKDIIRRRAVIALNETESVTPYESQADETVRLLDRVYNGTGTPVRNASADNLLIHVYEEVGGFMSTLTSYLLSTDEADRASLLAQLTASLQSTSPYCAFKRWIIRDNNLTSTFPSIFTIPA